MLNNEQYEYAASNNLIWRQTRPRHLKTGTNTLTIVLQYQDCNDIPTVKDVILAAAFSQETIKRY